MRRRIAVGVAIVLLLLLGWGFKSNLDPTELESRYAQPPSQFMALGDLRVHFRDQGRGHPIVLVHGTSASLHTWDGWADALTPDYRVIRMDLPAFGLTGPAPDADYSIDRYVTFLKRFVDALDLGAFTLAGNSLGGWIAWRYALAYPDDIAQLVLLDAAGYPRDEISLLIKLGAWPVVGDLMPWITPYPVVANQVRNVYGDPKRIAPGTIERYYALLRRRGNRKAFQHYTRQLVANPVTRYTDLTMITAPTLVMWGDQDRLIPVAFAERFGRDLSNATVQIYEGIGHIPMEEIPRRSARDLAQFIAAQQVPTTGPTAATTATSGN